ncbi:MAG: ribosome silencing factor [Deltaproteobacteria bacterium]|jgi:ribosome-associated protein|nr:ribosome silencing factor [Deltaproteobacteria bacterium]
MSDTKDPRLNLVLTAVMGKKALDIIVLDVSGLTSLADSFIICSGRSNRQVTAIADYIRTDLKKQGVAPLSVEGLREGHWVLMDYGDIVIHVFYDDVRRFYDLEGLWSDAPRIRTRALDDWNHRQIRQDAPTD